MDANLAGAAARMAARRHHSFSEALDAVLDELERVSPDGTVFFGQLEENRGWIRITASRGEAIDGLGRGAELPVGESAVPDPDLVHGLGLESFVAVPLETSEGHHVGSLCAGGHRAGLYDQGHLDLFTVMARLLAREWEIVQSRAEIQQLGERLQDRDGIHPMTGLADRDRLMGDLTREWVLSRRGTVRSYLLACRLEGLEEARAEHGEGVANLLAKDAAGALQLSLREVDHCGCAGDDMLVAVLVGCESPDEAIIAVARLKGVLTRVLEGRPAPLGLAFAIRQLEDAASPEEALADAEAGARATPARPLLADLAASA